jgi:predicted ABC-type exoprotein transport system permease subunit
VLLSIFRKLVPLAIGPRLSVVFANLSRDSFIFFLSFGLSLFVLAYIALLHDSDRDNVEWAWTLALFVLLVLAQCRTITLRIGLF